MLSNEEKKAYDNLIMLKYFIMEKEDKQAIDTILNLIEKQSKEIEELKKHQITFTNDYKPIGSKGRRFISEDKIKAKIEEYRQLLYSYEKEEEEKLHYVDKGSMNCILAQISILQSLL